MKKTLSILLTLLLLVGMLAVGTVSASAAETHVHRYDLNGKCIRCQKAFSVEELDAKFRDQGSASETLSFLGAESITITASVSNYFNSRGALEHLFLQLRDASGKAAGAIVANGGSCTVPGNTFQIEWSWSSSNVYTANISSVTPNYPKALKSENGVYQVNDEDDLSNLFRFISNGNNFSGATVSLNADLDLTGIELSGWWANSDKAFCGTFDGNNHTIKGLKDSSATCGGLFRTLGNGANIKNLTISGATVGGGTGKDNTRFGILAGRTTGTVTITNVTIDGGSVKGYDRVGGLIGEACGSYTIDNCKNSAAVTSTNGSAGGLVGFSNKGGTYKNTCTNSGTVIGVNAGGILGCNGDNVTTDLSGSKNTGNIGSGNGIICTYAGGIAGRVGSCDKDPKQTGDNCFNSGNITAKNGAGGIIGLLRTDSTGNHFCNCTNVGSVTSTDENAGGIIAISYGGGSFDDNKNLGHIKAYKCAGGIVGWNEDDWMNMYRCVNGDPNHKNDGNIGRIESTTAEAGGIVGYFGNTDHKGNFKVANSINYGKVTGKKAGGIVAFLNNKASDHDLSYCTNYGTIIGTEVAGGIWAKRVTSNGNYSNQTNYGSSTATGSVLSEGNFWIIIAVAVLAIGGVATLFIVKKKKKPATANGASTDDDE